MGKYTPAVIVHDLAPAVLPDWVRPLESSSSAGHERLVMCSTKPRELRPGARMDLGLWKRARRHVLDDVSVRKLSTLSGVGSRAVKNVLDTLRLENDVYTRRRGCR